MEINKIKGAGQPGITKLFLIPYESVSCTARRNYPQISQINADFFNLRTNLFGSDWSRLGLQRHAGPMTHHFSDGVIVGIVRGRKKGHPIPI